MNNQHTTWRQGYFVDQPQYWRWTPEQKAEADRLEKCKVRPYPTANAICVCPTPEEAKWIAERLNVAARLEQWGGEWIPFPQVKPAAGRKYLCVVVEDKYEPKIAIREWSWTEEFWEGRQYNERVIFYMPQPELPLLTDELNAINSTLTEPHE